MRRRRERRFLVDGIVRRTPVTQNMVLGKCKVPWRRQRQFQLDGIARRRPATPNRTMALLNMCCVEMIPGG